MSNLLFATPKELTGWLSKLASGKRVMAPRQEGPSVVFRAYTAKELAAADVNALLKRSYSSPKQAILPQCVKKAREYRTKNLVRVLLQISPKAVMI